MRENKVCIECKIYPVRQRGKYLCYSCFDKALRDLFRRDEHHEMQAVWETTKDYQEH